MSVFVVAQIIGIGAFSITAGSLIGVYEQQIWDFTKKTLGLDLNDSIEVYGVTKTTTTTTDQSVPFQCKLAEKTFNCKIARIAFLATKQLLIDPNAADVSSSNTVIADLNTVNNVYKIIAPKSKLSDWNGDLTIVQTKKEGDANPTITTHSTMTRLFSVENKKFVGKSSYFVGKATTLQNPNIAMNAGFKCALSNAAAEDVYETCYVKAFSDPATSSEKDFAKLTFAGASTKSTNDAVTFAKESYYTILFENAKEIDESKTIILLKEEAGADNKTVTFTNVHGAVLADQNLLVLKNTPTI